MLLFTVSGVNPHGNPGINLRNNRPETITDTIFKATCPHNAVNEARRYMFSQVATQGGLSQHIGRATYPRMPPRHVNSWYRVDAIQTKIALNYASATEQMCHALICGNATVVVCNISQFAILLCLNCFFIDCWCIFYALRTLTSRRSLHIGILFIFSKKNNALWLWFEISCVPFGPRWRE